VATHKFVAKEKCSNKGRIKYVRYIEFLLRAHGILEFGKRTANRQDDAIETKTVVKVHLIRIVDLLKHSYPDKYANLSYELSAVKAFKESHANN
jgi:hypothetical protein